MRLLDLFCGAGGAAMGYHRAGFEVVGVDIKLQPHYPFDFHRADALEYCADHGQEFDVIHASPPCQRYSTATAVTGSQNKHPDLLPITRATLIRTGKPWVIENVMGAPFQHYCLLCGTMFDLKVYRHRGFETSWYMFQPNHPKHREIIPMRGWGVSDTGWCGCSGNQKVAGQFKSASLAMKINWMIWKELTQAVPPAYTEFIGKHLMEILG